MDIDTLWTCFFSLIGGVALYAIVAVIWFVRLEGKVKSNEKVFNMYVENSIKRDDKIEQSIDNLFSITRKIEEMVNRLTGRIDGQ